MENGKDTDLPERHPLEQGLKRVFSYNVGVSDFGLPERHPLEQGLKRRIRRKVVQGEEAFPNDIH